MAGQAELSAESDATSPAATDVEAPATDHGAASANEARAEAAPDGSNAPKAAEGEG
ncbi:hypothetical protein D3C83_212290 [compost metagenome]